MYRLHCVTALSAIIAGASGVTGAQATVRVGDAVDIVRDVSGALPGQPSNKKVKGDDVYENEFIRTAKQSTAQIIFVDKTGIELGPTSTMKIDRVVFNPDLSVRALTVSASAGAMRWISGASRSSAYEIKTPTAAIKVEGTTFDLIVDSKRTAVVLQDGKVEVCSLGAQQQCKTLSERGDMIIATPGALDGPRRGGLGLLDFAALCLSVASQSCGFSTDRVSPPQHPPRGRETRKHPAEPPKQGTYKLESAPSTPPVIHPPPPKITVPIIPPVIHLPPPKKGARLDKPPPEIYQRPRHHHNVIASFVANKPPSMSDRRSDYGGRPTSQPTPKNPGPGTAPNSAPNLAKSTGMILRYGGGIRFSPSKLH